MYRIYSNLTGIPATITCELFNCSDTYSFVNDPVNADFFAFPCHYQVAYDYSEYEYSMHGLELSIKYLLQERFSEINRLAILHSKPVICFYLRDDTRPIPIESAIVFRSSLTRSGRQKNEFAYPANGRPLLREPNKEYPQFLAWTNRPSVGFVGQSLSLKLPLKVSVKSSINQLCGQFGLQAPFRFKYNFGYLHRRNAILALKKSKSIDFNFRLTTNQDYFDEASRFFYSHNLLSHQYALAASGHGNYSYRFYEIMEAGRIPLFVNTDCVLPLEELIDYKSLMVFTEAGEEHSIVDKLLDFHWQNQGAVLAKKQEQIQVTWQNYLQGDQFYRHIPFYLRHFS